MTATEERYALTPQGEAALNDNYTDHRQRGFAAKGVGDTYLFRCVCGWDSGYLPLNAARQALLDHIEDPTGDCR